MKARDTDHNDLLSKLFEIHHAKPEEFGFDDVVSMAATNVNAGSDTTAVSFRAIMYYLLKRPQYKQKLVEEVDRYFETAEKQEVCTFAVANSMPFLQAVMYEALRLHPGVGQTLPRVVPRQGLKCGEFFVPSDVSGNLHVQH